MRGVGHTDKDQRCHCDAAEAGKCPHCGRGENADQRASCHREALGLKPAVRVQRRQRFMMSEWRGNLRGGRRAEHLSVKHRLRRRLRQSLKQRNREEISDD
jgi:hypothetical protein